MNQPNGVLKKAKMKNAGESGVCYYRLLCKGGGGASNRQGENSITS